jgi:hypothetical protein
MFVAADFQEKLYRPLSSHEQHEFYEIRPIEISWENHISRECIRTFFMKCAALISMDLRRDYF